MPVNADPFFANDNKTPYSENYMVSAQRELAPKSVADARATWAAAATTCSSSVRRILAILRCASASASRDQVTPGSPTCGPFAENGVFTTAAGQMINGTRTTARPQFRDGHRAGDDRQIALQRVRAEPALHERDRGNVLAGYTLSKSMDMASNLGEQVNPFDIRRRRRPRHGTSATTSW